MSGYVRTRVLVHVLVGRGSVGIRVVIGQAAVGQRFVFDQSGANGGKKNYVIQGS